MTSENKKSDLTSLVTNVMPKKACLFPVELVKMEEWW